MISESTFLWHDYETFGANPRYDRPCQFAFLRTNLALEPIEPPSILYCQPTLDVLPHPTACSITGITPQYAQAHGDPEPRFAQQIYDVMSRPGTCVVGYNNLRFDDEVTRHLFWRNFLNPYQREFANGNSRFDLINVLRLTRALRPEGIEWVNYDDGRPNFRLEDLARANGLDTECAHDALVDVENTLGLAQAVHRHQPKLWAWALQLRDKSHVDALMRKVQPLLYAASHFANYPGSLAPILPLQAHPHISSQWVAWDLRVDPAPFLSMSEHELDHGGLESFVDQERVGRMPLVSIKTNACPMLAPFSVTDPESLDRLALEPQTIENYAKKLSEHVDQLERLVRYFVEQKPSWDAVSDPETELYAGFVPRTDQALVNRIGMMGGRELSELQSPFTDERLNQLLFRYRARHWSEFLSPEEQGHWHDLVCARLLADEKNPGLSLEAYCEAVETLANQSPEQAELTQALREWSKIVRDHLESHDQNSTT